jgi:sulfite reductase beta subunit-like hemoprotein
MANKVEDLKKAKDGLDVWPDLLRYSQTGYESITPDDMSRFRWYGIYEQQPKAGHFMMRVKIPGGDISSAQWRVLGEIARDFGNDLADITTRQNVQYHWLTIETIPEVIARMQSVGLSTVGACGDITRNICGCPVSGLDPDELYDCREVIQQITDYFNGNKEFSDLPRKYKMTIGGCAHECHQPQINDVGISAVRRPNPDAEGGYEVGFQVRVGGGLSTQPHLAQTLDMFVKPEQVAEVCRAITVIFRDYGYRERRNHARLKFLVADWGAEKFREKLVEILGWEPEPGVRVPAPRTMHRDHIGVHPQRQPGLHWVGVSVSGGRVSSVQMLAAADIADRYCQGVLRTTNAQNLLFPNIAIDDLEEAKAAIRAAGFKWEVSPFWRGGVACTGTEFCNLAITETKYRLREIVAHLEQTVVWDGDIRINVNGCPNSCGQHHIGDIGLQGCLARVGTEKVEAYDICLGGRLGENAKFTRAIERKVPATKVKFALENLLRAYQEHKVDADESFSFFVDRHTDQELAQFLGLHLLAEADPDFVPPPPRHAPAGVE